MDQATHSKIVSFLWGIADDVLRDPFKRGKYPDVILPMCVLRRRLHSQFSRKAIESLRFCSGDEAVREELRNQFGDVVFEDFESVRSALEKRLSEWGKTDENGAEDEGGDEAETPKPKSGFPAAPTLPVKRQGASK